MSDSGLGLRPQNGYLKTNKKDGWKDSSLAREKGGKAAWGVIQASQKLEFLTGEELVCCVPRSSRAGALTGVARPVTLGSISSCVQHT